MNLVTENINFERGIDPKRSLKIGLFDKWSQLSVASKLKIKRGFFLSNTFEIVTNPTYAGIEHQCFKGDYMIITDMRIDKDFYLDFSYYKSERDENGLRRKEFSSILKTTPEQLETYFEIVDKLGESINFERGKDPIDSLNIGLRPKLLKVLQFVHMEMAQASHKYFDEPISEKIWAFKKFLMASYHEKEDFNKAFHESIKRLDQRESEELKNVIKNEFGIEINSIKESMEFERGRDPKKIMNLGLSNKRNFENEKEILNWLLRFPEICTEGKYESWPKILPMKDKENLRAWIRVNLKIERKYNGETLFWIGIVQAERILSNLFLRIAALSESVNFERKKDPKTSMGIGRIAQIKQWLKDNDLLEDAIINDDLTIDIPENVNLVVDLKNKDMEELPEYIQFGIVYGGFKADQNRLKTLRGFPKEIRETEKLKGNFRIDHNQLTSLEHFPKRVDGNILIYDNPGKFSRSQIKKVCKFKGKLWGDEAIEERRSQTT